MKRSSAPSSAGGPKRPRGGDNEEAGGSQTFEEELMMMDGEENIGDERIDMEGIDDALIQVKRWARPESKGLNPQTSSLAFHWVDIDVTSGVPLEKNPCEGAKIIGSKEAVVPIIRLYGSTKDGSSVLTYVHGFTSYFYVALPTSTNLSDGARAQIRTYLDQRVRQKTTLIPYPFHYSNNYVHSSHFALSTTHRLEKGLEGTKKSWPILFLL